MKKSIFFAVENFQVKSVTKLEGCVNDIYKWKDVFVEFGFSCKKENIHINSLKEEGLLLLEDFITNLQPNDTGVFVFSGHGSSLAINEDKFEFYEGLLFNDCPLFDYELYEILEKIDPSVRLYIILDCCYSSGLVVPFVYKKATNEYLQSKNVFISIDEDICPTNLKSSSKSFLGLHKRNPNILVFSATNSKFRRAFERKFKSEVNGLFTYYSKNVLRKENPITIYEYELMVNQLIAISEIDRKTKNQRIKVFADDFQKNKVLNFE